MNNTKYGKVVTGHKETSNAAWAILQEGGNAFDAALAAILGACVAESASISIGGGGFLLSHQPNGQQYLYDFFTQTPLQKRTDGLLDFFPAEIRFKDNSQIFHVGLGSAATPGIIAGLFKVHSELGSIPFKVIAEPAIELAKNGVVIDDFQEHLLQLVYPIIRESSEARKFFLEEESDKLKKKGKKVFLEGLEDTLYVLANEGPREFYEGEIAARICKDSEELGGHFTRPDFKDYRVLRRKPLQINYRDFQFITNPPPSAGGILIGFCLALLESFDLQSMKWGSQEYIQLLGEVMQMMNVSRSKSLDRYLQHPNIVQHFLGKEHIASYLQSLNKKADKLGSTTHISVMDKNGNAASTTISSGAGNSYYIPQTGIMMNNMLGEADLNPRGFHQWRLNQRMSSMMSPSMLLKNRKARLVLGSSGSNRIRSAVLQSLLNWTDFQMPLEEAIQSPRLHLEGLQLNIEKGFDEEILSKLQLPRDWQRLIWTEKSMFFGGVNGIAADVKGNLKGFGDERRFGVVMGE
ncbi:MAG: gamma-glutamyltransferase [Chitinophagales bacterium]